MAPKPQTIQKRMRQRVETAKKTHRIAEAAFDPETGAAVLVAQNSDMKLVALFFDPTTTRRFDEVEISAHQRVSLGSMLKQRLAEALAIKNAPHNMKVGDIFVYSFGATIRRVTFFRVTGIPHPQKIAGVALRSKVTFGTLDTGTVVPDLEAPIPETSQEVTFNIAMSDDRGPYLKTGKGGWQIERGGPWDGTPQHNMQD